MFTLDGIDYYPPWNFSGCPTDGLMASPSTGPSTRLLDDMSLPEANPDLNEGRDGPNGVADCKIYKGKAYLKVVYERVVDTVVYDVVEKTGYWMSGAEDPQTFYAEEIALLKDMIGDPDAGPSTRESARYRNYDVSAFSYAHNSAVVRRSRMPGPFEDQYFMVDLETREEMYLCPSWDLYANRDDRPDALAESLDWLDPDTLLIRSAVDRRDGWYHWYLITFTDRGWRVELTSEEWVNGYL
jgi:hypothetical protein